MSPSGTAKMLVMASVLILVFGSIDAGISGAWDLFTLFVIGLGFNLALTPASRVAASRDPNQT